jgi:4-aminobutyrate aminotransferase-like enzyme
MATEDEMENAWGTDLVPNTYKHCKKSFGDFDKAIRSDVPGYKLENCVSSGTNANQDAMLLASNCNLELCLYAQGSYVGGNRYTQEVSTSMYDAKSLLSVPRFPDNATQRCLMQTVALPYWVDCTTYSDSEKCEHENRCLRQLHLVLVIGRLAGKAHRALLIEYILGGNGGELSMGFLTKLGCLLKVFGVVVVADEVLTGGRVGPDMVMTTRMPKEFRERVEYITMGKFMHCALILKQVPKKPTQQDELLRGTSTNHDAGEPLALWNLVRQQQKNGVIEKRQKQVMEKMRLKKDSESIWGRGILLFSRKTRWQLTKGLKNRMLPMMVTNYPIRPLSCKKSKWNRSTVTKFLRDGAEEWMDAQV